MQIQRVQINYSNYNKQNILNNAEINFSGAKQKLVPISSDSFKSESAKKLYSKIQRYFQTIGESGSVKDVKLMNEKLREFHSDYPYMFNNVDADVCLSINKGDRNSNIKLYHKYQNAQKKDVPIFNATIDKNGQMFVGEFFPKNLMFERNGKNIRRMYSNFSEDKYLPIGNSDKEWSCLGKPKLSSERLIYDSEKGAFEIFIELARLKTSIL